MERLNNRRNELREKKIVAGRSLWVEAWRRLRRNKLAMIGLGMIGLVIFCAVFAPLVAPYDPVEQRIWKEGAALRLARPYILHWFGTDTYGRDIFSRVIHGTRISLSIALAATTIAVLIGVTLGALAGYYAGFIDDAVSWLMNVIFAFPFLLFVIALVAYLPPSLPLMYGAIGIVFWVAMGRLVRGQVLACKGREFVEAAVALGARDGRIIFRHILPNVLSPMIVHATLNMGQIVILEAALSYLGLGVQPPKPAWGLMCSQGQEYLAAGKWWWGIFPGLAIVVTVLGFNLFGDGLRDALDPRLKM